MIVFKPHITKKRKNRVFNDWCSGFWVHRIAEFNNLSEHDVIEILTIDFGLSKAVVKRRTWGKTK